MELLKPDQLNAYLEQISLWLLGVWETVTEWATSPAFYAQIGAILTAVTLAWVVARILRKQIPLLREAPQPGRFYWLRSLLYALGPVIFPVINILFLGIAIGIAEQTVEQSGLVRLAESLAVVLLLYRLAKQFISSNLIRALAIWVGIPMATLEVFGLLDDVTAYLDGISLSAGNIRVSLLALLRTLLFGIVLFWLGRISNDAGKQAIRSQASLDIGTREVFAKLFEIGLYVVMFLLLLQIMGINLTALAVFGGALGVGLGFGLQQIASNFISGLIILLDRSVSIGDYIELEDGRSGTLRELNMRHGIIETFDGKDVMVPNEQFITSSYTNWTHKDPRQRYAIEFQVAYGSDLEPLFENLRRICREHPTVLSGDHLPLDYQPDAEIAGFGDSGIDILVEYWMEGIDDGKNRVGADLLHSFYNYMVEAGVEIPFPQREVRILNP
ncbi:MAG: mechanosensitive ion channel domain-containing protein [Pseudomonadota bacterium]